MQLCQLRVKVRSKENTGFAQLTESFFHKYSNQQRLQVPHKKDKSG